MHVLTRSTITRVATGAIAGLLTMAALTAPAQAHETPKAGSTCAMSGMTELDHGKVYVCTSAREGTKPRWGKGMTTRKTALTLTDSWAKAADSGMSAGFGVLRNPGTAPIRVIGAFTTFSPVVQLHEVVDKDGAMTMQQKAGGFVIPAGGSLTLRPGGDQLTLTKLTKPIAAGTSVPITLITSDGGLLTAKWVGRRG